MPTYISPLRRRARLAEDLFGSTNTRLKHAAAREKSPRHSSHSAHANNTHVCTPLTIRGADERRSARVLTYSGPAGPGPFSCSPLVWNANLKNTKVRQEIWSLWSGLLWLYFFMAITNLVGSYHWVLSCTFWFFPLQMWKKKDSKIKACYSCKQCHIR